MATLRPGGHWELRLFHEVPAGLRDGNGLAAGDIDGDGRQEIVVGGNGSLFWYRPATEETGVIAEGGMAYPEIRLEDVDGDGVLEVVTGYRMPDSQQTVVAWFKPDGDLARPWRQFTIDPDGGGHDTLFADVDGDGERELLTNNGRRGTALYKRGRDVTAPWRKHLINTSVFREGLAAADFDGDGRVEVIHGPDMFVPPADGPYSGL